MQGERTMLNLLAAKDTAPQLKVYVLGNLMLVEEQPREVRAHIWSTQMLVMSEMLELAARHPELALKMAEDMRKYGPEDHPEELARQVDYIANTDQQDVLAAMGVYRDMVRAHG